MLNYISTNPNPRIIFKWSDMVLWAYSDASYLCAPKAHSRGVEYIFLGDESIKNRPIQVLCKLFKVVVSSAAEAELVAIFMTAKTCVNLCQALITLGYTQPPTPLITDNATTTNLSNDNLKQKHGKSMDMRFY